MEQGLSSSHPASGAAVQAAFEAVYSWNYESEVDQLRALYANGLQRQWIALRDLDWEADIDRDAFARTFSIGGIPIQATRFWQELAPQVRWEVSSRSAAFMLSNFLHGEQGALMVAAQLVNAVPHMDGKFYAATQTLDEARHVEVFSAYVRKLGSVHPIAPGLRAVLDAVLETDDWVMKTVGMQVVAEGLALYSFRDMRNRTEEPLLSRLLTYVARDEARHTAFGVKYLGAVLPSVADGKRAEIEDFAFEAARNLLDPSVGTSMRQSVLELWRDAGLDPADVVRRLADERETLGAEVARRGGRFGPLRGFVLPTLRSIGLYSERIAACFDQLFAQQRGELAELPADLDAWVNEGYENV